MPDTQQLLSNLQSPDKDVRFAAWRSAGEADASAIPEIGKLVMSSEPGVSKAAREALTTMTHAVGAQENHPRRAGVVEGLMKLAAPGQPVPVRALSLRLLSLIAPEDRVPAIAAWLNDATIGEEAIFCLERIPGPASDKAIMAAYKTAKPAFQPRLLAALGHRKVAEAAPLCQQAMRSTDPEIAMAATKALGRIGPAGATAAAAGGPRFPETGNLSEWQKIERMDSILRYAEASAAKGAAGEAMRLYQIALGHPEEHLQCAAIIGIARLGTAEAAATIFPKLKSENVKVRITARQAWDRLAAAAPKA
jgi:HEAT repeat protein